MKTVLGGWELSGIALFESGTPFSHRRRTRQPRVWRRHQQPRGYRRAGHLSEDPVPVVQHLVVRSSRARCSGARRRGTTWSAPGRNNWNMALFKAFQVKEKARFEFRAETFNTFNHTQFDESQHERDRRRLRTDQRAPSTRASSNSARSSCSDRTEPCARSPAATGRRAGVFFLRSR